MSDTTRIADAFAAVLKDWLTAEEFEAMRRDNAVETDKAICHSHDYCDANMAMVEALHGLGMATVANSAAAGKEKAMAVWTSAWNDAKARHLTAR